MEHHPANQPLVAAYAGEGTSQHSTYLLESVWSFIATRDVIVEQALSLRASVPISNVRNGNIGPVGSWLEMHGKE